MTEVAGKNVSRAAQANSETKRHENATWQDVACEPRPPGSRRVYGFLGTTIHSQLAEIESFRGVWLSGRHDISFQIA